MLNTQKTMQMNACVLPNYQCMFEQSINFSVLLMCPASFPTHTHTHTQIRTHFANERGDFAQQSTFEFMSLYCLWHRLIEQHWASVQMKPKAIYLVTSVQWFLYGHQGKSRGKKKLTRWDDSKNGPRDSIQWPLCLAFLVCVLRTNYNLENGMLLTAHSSQLAIRISTLRVCVCVCERVLYMSSSNIIPVRI